eukprot:1589768-Pyramimonas_sp.AAC.1
MLALAVDDVPRVDDGNVPFQDFERRKRLLPHAAVQDPRSRLLIDPLLEFRQRLVDGPPLPSSSQPTACSWKDCSTGAATAFTLSNTVAHLRSLAPLPGRSSSWTPAGRSCTKCLQAFWMASSSR